MRAEVIPATDRGLAYGDGVFRTLRAQNGVPMHWARHYAKLANDCAALHIPPPYEALLLAEARAVALPYPHAAVKIIITRGNGPRGYALPELIMPSRVVMSTPLCLPLHAGDGITAYLCQLRLARQPALAGVKHLNRLENVLARAEWSDTAIAEGLLLDQEGLAIGGTMCNLFIVEQNVLATPLLTHCGVAGVTRARIFDIAAKASISCREEHLPLQRLLNADEVFFVNSLIGLWPVAKLNTRRWCVRPMAKDILGLLEAEDATLV